MILDDSITEDTENPFPGLRPFDENDAHLFFGREEQVTTLVARLRENRFVALVGMSGIGKSSLVRAGLQFALHGGSMKGGGSRWRIALMRPENTPTTNLATALDAVGIPGYRGGEAEARIGLTQAILERGPLGLVDAVAQTALPAGTNVLVIVDQFEELFRFRDSPGGGNADEAAAFVKLLIAASRSKNVSVYVLLTMRSEYIGRCAQYRDLAEKVNDGLFLIPRMKREQLARAIEGPVEVSGAKITPSLVNRLINDIGDDPDQLPVLQHVLMRCWDVWRRRKGPDQPIDMNDYLSTGEVKEALSRHADEVLETLNSYRRELAERVFKALTQRVGDQDAIRRPNLFATLCEIVAAPPDEVEAVVNAFRAPGVTFLMPPPDQPLVGHTIDIAHEALIRIWGRLLRWVDEETRSAQTYARLAEVSAMHKNSRAGLLREPEVTVDAAWRARAKPNPAWAKQYGGDFETTMEFLDRSIRSKATRKAAVVAVGLLILSVLASFAFGQNRDADHARRLATASHMIDVAAQRSPTDPLAMLLTTEAYAAAPGPITAGSMLSGIRSFPGPGRVRVPDWTAAVLADHGREIAIVTRPAKNAAAELIVLDAGTLEILSRSPDFAASTICGFTGAPRLAALSGGNVSLLEWTRSGISVTASRPVRNVDAMACSPGASTVVLGERGGRVSAVDLTTGAASELGYANETPGAIEVSPGGTLVATVAQHGRGIDVFRLHRQPEAPPRTSHIAHIAAPDVASYCGRCGCGSMVAFDRSDARLAWYDFSALNVANTDGSHMDRYAWRNPNERPRKQACTSFTVTFTDDTGNPSLLTHRGLYAVERRRVAKQVALNTDPGVGRPAYDQELKLLLTGEGGLSTRSIVPSVAMPFIGGQPASSDQRYAFSGPSLIMPAQNGWQAYDMNHYLTSFADAPPASTTNVLLRDSGDGEHAVAIDRATGTVSILNIRGSPTAIASFPIPSGTPDRLRDIRQIAFAPDSQRVTVAWSDHIEQFSPAGQTLRSALWSELERKAGLKASTYGTQLSARGTFVLVSSEKYDYLVTTDGVKVGDFNVLNSVSRDERYVFGQGVRSGSGVGVFRVTSASGWLVLQQISGLALSGTSEAASTRAAISPDGRTIAYGTATRGSITLFDLATRSAIGELSLATSMKYTRALSFSADSRYLIVDYQDEGLPGSIAVFALDPVAWQRSLCMIAGTRERERELDAKAREKAFGEDYSYENACERFGFEDVLRDPPPRAEPNEPPKKPRALTTPGQIP